MRPQDTSPEAWEIQLKIYRNMPPLQRLGIALDLTASSRSLLEKGIRLHHPEYSEQEIRDDMLRLWFHDDDLYRRFSEKMPHPKS